MTDVFLYQGEANPNDVKLRDPTTSGSSVDHPATIAVTLADVSASINGTVGHPGTVSVQLADLSSSLNGTTGHPGTLAITLADADASINGTTGHPATVEALLDDVVVNLTAEWAGESVTPPAPPAVVGGGLSSSRKKYKKKDFYIERDGEILLFRSPEEVEAYLSAEALAKKAIGKAKKSSKVRPPEPKKIEVAKIKQVVRILKPDIKPAYIDRMIQEMDWSALLKLQKALERWQDEEDMKLLLALT